jgi:gliding motility-associated-like protein
VFEKKHRLTIKKICKQLNMKHLVYYSLSFLLFILPVFVRAQEQQNNVYDAVSENNITALSIVKKENGTKLIRWNRIKGAKGYAIKLDKGNWIFVKNTDYLLAREYANAIVTIRGVYDNNQTSLPFSAQLMGSCGFDVSITGVTVPTCFGYDDGTIILSYSGSNPNGQTPVLNYQLDNGPIFNNPIINQAISGGNHLIVATDALSGCKDTLPFFMPQPDSINLQVTIDTATCATNNLGCFTALATGGTPPFSYYWNSFPATFAPKICNLIGGTTRVIQVTDNKGCQKSLTVTMPSVTTLPVTLKVDAIKCYGQNNGAITANAIGSGLTYTWKKNGAAFGGNTSSITNLAPANYTVTVADAKGCTYTNSINLTEPTPLSIEPTVTKPSCDKNDGEIEVKGKGGTPNYTYLWDYQNATTTKISNLGVGTYKITVTDKNGCEVDSSFSLPLLASVKATLKVNNVQCSGLKNGSIDVILTSPNGVSYLWSDAKAQTTSTAANLEPGTYTVTITEKGSGCVVTLTEEVKDLNPIDLQVGGSTAKCFDSNQEVAYATVTGGNGGFLLKWSNGIFGDTIKALQPGIYTVVATDTKGCSQTKSVTINAPSALKFAIEKVTNVKCFGDNTGSIEVLVNGGTGAITYQWDDLSLQKTPTISNLLNGQYTVVATDANGCTVSKALEVKSPEKLTNTLTVKTPKCNNGVDGEIATDAQGGVKPYTYEWENLLATTPKIQNINSGFYKVIIKDKNNCVVEDTVTLINPPKLVLDLQQLSKGCAGLNNSAAVINVKGGIAPFEYLWSDKNKTKTATIQNIGKGTYTVTVTDFNKCVVSATQNITEQDSITATVSFKKATCANTSDGEAAVTTVVGGGGNGNINQYTFSWSNGDVTPTIVGLESGKTYTVKISDNVGCASEKKIFIPVTKAITINVKTVPVKCFDGNNGEISIAANSENGNLTYEWLHDSAVKDSFINNAIAGDYVVKVIDDKGCEAEKDITLTEPEALVFANVNIKNVRCFGENQGSITLGASGGTPKYNYTWFNGSKQTSLSDLKIGKYQVTLSDANGCAIKDTFEVKQPAPLTMSVDIKDVSCFGAKDGAIKIIPSGGTLPYTFSNTNSSYNTKSQYINQKSGVYTLFVKDKNGCVINDDVEIKQPEKFSIIANNDTSLYFGSTTKLFVLPVNNQGQVKIEWTAPSKDAISCSSCDTTIAKMTNTMTVFVKATDEEGCVATEAVALQPIRNKDVFVPTGFTPNFDGENDKIIIHGREGTKVLWFKVYDRWGEQLFENYNFEINCMMCGWDGSFRGVLMPMGVYTWAAEVESINGERNILKGNTTLLR